MTSVSISLTFLPVFAISASRNESTSFGLAGSMLNLLPLTISIGGSSLCTARAMTDLAVPREPEMTTPPIFGFTPHSSRAVLIAS